VGADRIAVPRPSLEFCTRKDKYWFGNPAIKKCLVYGNKAAAPTGKAVCGRGDAGALRVKGLPDILAEGLDVVFCGINPASTAAAAGHHFVARTNRFWRVIHRAGFTPQEIDPKDDHTILEHGCGLTAVVDRPTARADQLSAEEFIAAAAPFERKISNYMPRFVAFLGKAAYSVLSDRRDVAWGSQAAVFGGAAVWVLPNPSGLNRAFSLDQLVSAYRNLHQAVSARPMPPAIVPAQTHRRSIGSRG
jgi:TDG/mug DNA glycosylase family protein